MQRSAGPRITTVLPTYQRPELLARAIRSVLAQTYPAIQLCVYDNASADRTEAVVRGFAERDPRVHYYRHEQNIGGPQNFRFGLERVDTEYFSFLSDDDLLLPRFYELGLETLERDRDLMFVASQILQVDERGRIFAVQLADWRPGRYEPPDGLLRMLHRGHPNWVGLVFRRQVRDIIGGLDAETGSSNDMDYALRAAARCAFVVRAVPGVIFSATSTSASANPRLSSVWPCWLKMIRNLAEDPHLQAPVRAEAKRLLDRRLAQLMYIIGVGASSRGQTEDARGAAQVLRSRYRQRFRPLLLDGVATVCERLPGLRRFLRFGVEFKRWLQSARLRSIQASFDRDYRHLLGLEG